MKKVELLSPVGNMEMLYFAVHNGADAIYLSGTKYGARAYARNFNEEELINAIKYCHLYGVKVYITVNTLIYENEIEDFLKYIEFIHKNNVDAVIMQDLGMIYLVRQLFPNLEVHASTQCHNHNDHVLELFKSLGVTRTVLAREMSINEINNLKTEIEKEVFVYGALCVSYSGCCLFSSMNGGRSGNRGECVGSCRLPYKLIKNNEEVEIKDKYILSTKDLNTLDYIEELLKSNIDSLKIEGRMKSPYYVGYITKLYRTMIDNYYQNKNIKLTEEQLNNLKKIFNREFTKGYLFNDKDIMNIKTPNHQGIYLGKVIKQDKNYIYIKLENDNLYQEDSIRFKNTDKGLTINKLYTKKLLLTNKVEKNDIAVIENKFKVKNEDIVLKTIDKKLIDNISDYSEKKINVDIKCTLKIGEKLKLEITDEDNNKAIEYGDIVEKSITKEVDNENITKSLSKLGNTPFKLNNLKINKDDSIFISLKNINEVRRSTAQKLTEIRMNKVKEIIVNEINNNYTEKENNNKTNINILVRNETQLNCALDNNVDNIYVTDEELYNKYKNNKNIYLRLERINNNYKEYNNEQLLITEPGSIKKYNKTNKLVADYYLNVTNSKTIEYLNKQNIELVTLSVELKDYEITSIMNKTNKEIELIVYGKPELMVMKYCPLKKILNYCNKCKEGKDKFYIQDISGNKYPMTRKNCITHILDSKNINKINDIDKYNKINNFRIELFEENYEEAKKIIMEVKDKLTKNNY